MLAAPPPPARAAGVTREVGGAEEAATAARGAGAGGLVAAVKVRVKHAEECPLDSSSVCLLVSETAWDFPLRRRPRSPAPCRMPRPQRVCRVCLLELEAPISDTHEPQGG